MLWSNVKKARTQNLNSDADTELENAQRETVSDSLPPTQGKPVAFDESAEVPERPGLFSRIFGGKPKQPDVFVIQPRWARGAVKACFVPLAKYQHPAWALTDDEADKIAPEMQTLMQATFNRYVPSVLNDWAAKHTEIANLMVGLVSLYYVKYQMVQKAMLAEEAEAKVIEISKSPDDVQVDEVRSAESSGVKIPYLCGVCKKEFENVKLYNLHLPCRGPN